LILLVSGATVNVARADAARVGVLFVPGAGNALESSNGRPCAIDNAAFSGFDATAFLALLTRLRGVNGCLFAVAPDVVADSSATLDLFKQWAPVVRSFGFPVALAAQDGLTVAATPWDQLDALFIGGSTEWKMSRAAEELLAYAAARGKWRHVGRVNTLRRMRHFSGLCDSIDGSGFSKWPKRIALFEEWQRRIKATPRFELEAL
jgi:hypothetical protein